MILQTRTLRSECQIAFWLPSIKASKSCARMFLRFFEAENLKLDPINSNDILNSILNEEFLSDGDSEEPIEESWTNELVAL